MPTAGLGFVCQFSTADPTNASQTWQDITPYVLNFSIRRGKQRVLDRFEAGTMDISLDNRDRRFDPTHASGPYFGSLYPLRQIRFGFVINGATRWAFTGYIERWPQVWKGPTWAQVDLTCTDAFELLANAEIASTYSTLTTSFGSNSDLLFTAVIAGFVGNAISVRYLAATGTTSRLAVTVAGTDVTIQLGYDPSNGSYTTALNIMSRINDDPVANQLLLVALAPGSTGVGTPPQLPRTYLSGTPYTQQLSGARVTAVLDQISWPATARVISTGSKQIQAQAINKEDQTKALDQLYDIENTEQGALYIDKSGNVTFLDRVTLSTGVYATSQLNLVDTKPQSGNYEYRDLKADYDHDLIYNDVRVTRLNGTEQAATDSTSQTRYFKRTLTLTPLSTNDNEAYAIAQLALAKFKDPQLRFEPVALFPGNDVNYWSVLTNLDLMYRVTINRQPPGGGRPIQQGANIIGIQIAGNPGPVPNVQWMIAVDPSPNAILPFIFNDSTYGKFNGPGLLTF